MLVCLFGPSKAGKNTIAEWLCDRHSFTRLHFVQSGTNQSQLSFESADEIMEFILANYRWKQDWVLILPEQVLHRTESLVAIKRRPFSLCILIDAPLMMRYKRSVEGLGGVVAQLTLEQFVEQSDLSLFNDRRMPTSLLADMIIINDFLNQSALHDHIDSITPSITDKTRLRPEWDDYFMLLADLAAHRSNCMKRRVGCIIVRDCRVIASGYNGTARGIRNCNEGGCGRCNKGEARCGQGLAECLCLHAEENALLEIGRLGGNGASLYCNTCPCLSCAKKIIQTGVKEVIYHLDYGMDEMSKSLFKEAGVVLRKHSTSMDLIIMNNIWNNS